MNLCQLAALNTHFLIKYMDNVYIFIHPRDFKRLLIDPLFIEDLNIKHFMQIKLYDYRYIKNHKLRHFYLASLLIDYHFVYLTYGLSFQQLINLLSQCYTISVIENDYICLNSPISTIIESFDCYVNCCQENGYTYIVIFEDKDYYITYKFNTFNFDIMRYHTFLNLGICKYIRYNKELKYSLYNGRFIFNKLIQELEPFIFLNRLI